MLVAERDALHASVNHERLNIKERELLNLTTYLNSIGTQAALIAGFVYGTVMTQLPNGVHPALKYAVHVSSSISLGAMVYVICNSELTSIFGSTMALVGPPGACAAPSAARPGKEVTQRFARQLPAQQQRDASCARA